MTFEEWQEALLDLGRRVYTALREYDRYSPGDELRLDYRNDYLLSLLEVFVPLIKAYFRYEVIGLEHIPAKGRAVLVSNHGILPVDGLLLNYAIKYAYGRWPRGLTDRRIFKIPVLRQFFMDMGVVLAHPRTGQELLEREEIVYIMPGGAKEAFKSSRERYKLMWRRRMGFVRLAIRTGSPIIPAVCIGVDDMYHVFFDGYKLSERIFGKDVLLPITLPVGLGPLPFPVKLTHYIGRPIRTRLRPEEADDPEKVARLHRRVLTRMKALLEQGMQERALREAGAARSGPHPRSGGSLQSG
jgi:1-acyl-sn-glycerol-3-phosphate acyltransferase